MGKAELSGATGRDFMPLNLISGIIKIQVDSRDEEKARELLAQLDEEYIPENENED